MPEKTQKTSTEWSQAQVYGLALICLVVGVAVGYLLRGSSPLPASPAPVARQAGQAPPSAGGAAGNAQVTPEQLKHMADKQAEPVLAQLAATPNDPALLAQAGNIYFDTQQFKDAVNYYNRALQRDPNNSNVRTDMATAYWYLGDPDRAIAEFDRVLKKEPNKPNALFNRGIVRWQGKMDIKGAVADWEALLKADPQYPQRSAVEQLIAQAKQHANIKPGEKTSKPAM
jgi:cytochrome c-type biogenesis protein CcmH/NrfG